MDFLKTLIKEVGGEYTQIASDIKTDEEYVDTGSYILNALISGSIYGGVSKNKITTFSGLQASGKTFYSLSVVKNFLDTYPDAYCLYFDTESAVNRSLLESKGIDLNRVVVLNVVTVEEFRTKALKAVDMYLKTPEKERKPCMFVLDSLGMLSTNKEIQEALADSGTRDMTRAQLIKGAFRMLTLKLGQAEIPMIVTNHVYASMSGQKYPQNVQSGGTGMQYSASTIIELSKAKEKDGDETVGVIITAKTVKSRLSKENQQVKIRLFYDERGIDRYYGLPEIAVEAKIWNYMGTKYEIDGKKYYGKQILKEPEKFFTDEVMKKLDDYCKKVFSYGSSLGVEISGED
jgi:RecA/RadA recombinase